MSFGSVTVGQTKTATLTINNTGNATLTVNSVSCPTGFKTDWPSGTVAAGSSKSVTITFSPTWAGSYGGNISVSSNAPNSPHTISASGTGAVAAAPSVQLSGSLAFGNIAVGSQSSKTFEIRNTGNAPLTVSMIDWPSGYTVSWSTQPIPAGGSINATVVFKPTGVQSYAGNLKVHSNASGSPHSIPVSGTGVQAETPKPVISVTSSLSFGNVNIGQTKTATLTIKNTGNADLEVKKVGPPEGFSGSWSGIIAKGGSRDVTITFAPSRTGAYNGYIMVYSDASNGLQECAVSGTGVQAAAPAVSLSGNMSFGSVTAGQTKTATLTINNTGNATLTVNSVSCPNGFSASWTSGTVAAGSSKSVTIAFSPTSAGSYGGNISVSSNAPNSPHTISASGTGAQPQTTISVSTTSLSFGNWQVNAATDTRKTFTITNTGSSTLTVNSISSPSGFAAGWSNLSVDVLTPQSGGFTLSAGASKTVTVGFYPTSVKSYSGSISIQSSASNGTQYISVSGAGVAAEPTFTPAKGTYTNVPTSSVSCSGHTLTGNTIRATVSSYNSSSNTVNFTIKKASGSFSTSGTLYVKDGSYCGNVLKSVTFAAGAGEIYASVVPNSRSGTYSFVFVINSNNSTSDWFYTQSITVKY
jgi:uncharacterized membrane protein